MTMTYTCISGHYIRDDGMYEFGILELSARDGVIHGGECGRITAQQFEVVPGVVDVEITSAHGVWRFVPDAGECERIGLAVTPLLTA